MKRLVLAEKPSVGRDIAKALNIKNSKNDFIEGKGYVVTWGLGHLVTLSNPELYDNKYKSWKIEDLPIIPNKLSTVVIKKTQKQFNTVKYLMNRKDIGEIIIATDAGREGELVARWIVEKAKVKKPIKRLWISSVTDKAIKDGFRNLKDGRNYENLYKSAKARAEADWYVGINGTRALTCKYNAQLSCGRVQTPTLQMVNDREDSIRNFKPKKFYGLRIVINGKDYEWRDENNSNRSFDENKINKVIDNIKNKKISEIKEEGKIKKSYAKNLYDLTELQKDANRIYGYSAKETLNIMQRLYENHKVLTYPRTDSKYLTKDIISTFKERIVASAVDELKEFANKAIRYGIKYNKSMINDSKVTDHHAIIPTEEKPNTRNFTDKEWKIYSLVTKRFLANFFPANKYEVKSTEIFIGREKFISKTEEDIEMGWKEIYEEKRNGKVLAQILDKNLKFEIKKTEGQTTPPDRFTEGTLLGAMENPSAYIEIKKEHEKTLKQTGGIGTVATRADIIDKLFNTFLLEKREDKIYITSKGKQLLELVPSDLKSPILTAEWEKKLQQISDGKMNIQNFINDIKEYSKKIVKEIKNDDSKFRHDNITGSKCPKCGKYMLEVNSKKGKMLVCQDRECGHREMISIATNARCPECNKRMELRGRGEDKKFICKCGYREKMSSFNKRKQGQKNNISKREVNNYLKNQKNEEINSSLKEALLKFKF